jgi:ATPase family associated with various cellular activities (AAA)
VLIDEADVFLEERSLDFFRSELVAVFLRELEYFQGILIMTTNRLKRFDTAFQSRIHVALKFNELDEDARLSVWKSALPADCEISEDAIRKLAKKEVNGRQVGIPTCR